MATSAYAELHCWSNFSFLEGGSHPEELVDAGLQLGLAGLALTDRDGLYGAVRFNRRAAERRLAAICGAELTLETPGAPPVRAGRPARPAKEVPTDSPRLVLLAEDKRGYANLTRLISTAQLRGRKRDARLRLDDLDGHTDGLIALSGGCNGLVEKALLRRDDDAALALGAQLRDLFPGRFHLELQHHMRPEDPALVRALVALGTRLGIPAVATNGVAYVSRDDGFLADVLACVKYGTTLEAAGTLLRPNHEHYLKSPAQMARLFAEFPGAVSATLAIAERCTFRLLRLDGEFPLFPLPATHATPHSYLRALVYDGAARRYGSPLPGAVLDKVEAELKLIAEMDLAGYFLVVWDIVRAAKERNVLAQGRGSAANSIVCYALEITAIDPVEHGMLFERFLSKERGEVPDIDIDFAHQDREAVIQYVYDRYDREHAAMVAEVITYRTRSAIRDVGKALGLTLGQVDAVVREYDARESLSGALGSHDDATPPPLPASVAQRRDFDAGSNAVPSRTPLAPSFHGADLRIDPDGPLRGPVSGPLGALLLTLCRRLDGFPRHVGIHSGGMVITRSPLIDVAPVEWASMRDRTVVQWDKDDLNDLGLIKIDLLGLGMLSLLREAFSLYHRCYPEREQLTLYGIPADDVPTYEMLQRADSIGVFQVESRAQMSMLPRLKPTCFYDLVMQVAIIRPGPIQGGMIHPFLARRKDPSLISYPHPSLKPILEKTWGVPLFQEQGMRIAMETAGLSAGKADELRRAMGHKRSREKMAAIKETLVSGMTANGIPRENGEQLFAMLEGFADYGFPESHAASFALLAYASAFLKCHEPAIFCAAILNVQPMGFYSTEVLVNDARRHGVVVEPIAVNASEWWSHVDARGALRLGYHLVRGFGEMQQVRVERALADGPFADLIDFARRTKLGREAIENLAAAGAFACWHPTRREAMWALRAVDEREARGELGRAMEIENEPHPKLRALSPVETTQLDLRSTGVSPVQPMAHFRAQLDAHGVLPIHRLAAMPKNLVCKVGGMVITRQRPGTAKGFVFLTLEDEFGLINVIVRPDVYERHRRAVRGASCLIVEGTLQKEDGCLDLIMKRCWSFDPATDTVKDVRSRNFQ
ncbi:MAG TPA: DNA polymerase III subunit alpha [Candidatus Sulfotelmatobacter sp.]|nr:DNA polymerase III subunit alpha [Candidatus Sulfotelmatobacter sp.]